jgi:protein-disulfide isomerase
VQADTVARSIGVAAGATPANGLPVVDVVVYGDYQEENTVRVDWQIREAMRTRVNVRYTFRHYPLDRACNPALPENLPPNAVRPLACLAARAVEAAGAIAGNDGYWRLHTWLMQNRTTLSDATVRVAVKDFGWEVDAFNAAMAAPANLEAIAEDCNAAKRIGLTSIPYVVVNNKWVPRTSRSGDNVMGRIIEEASRK